MNAPELRQLEPQPYLAYNVFINLSKHVIEQSAMTLEITVEQMARYRATAQRRRQERTRQLALRHHRAWELARQAGQVLKKQFGAQRVVIFGSVCFPERFHEHSDVDLAVWGIDERDYYRAIARLFDLDPTISVDLIEAEFASPHLLALIEREGVAV